MSTEELYNENKTSHMNLKRQQNSSFKQNKMLKKCVLQEKINTSPNIIENLPSGTGKTSAIEPKMVKAENLVG